MSSLVELAAAAASGGGLAWIGTVLTEMVRGRNQSRDVDSQIEAQRDGLTFQLLEAARTELRELRQEVQRLRPVEAHLLHFDEALMHVERLLVVPCLSGNREQIEREARAFLKRVSQVRRPEDKEKTNG